MKVMDKVQQSLGQELEQTYKIPKTKNNYKGEIVASCLIPGDEIAKTKFPPSFSASTAVGPSKFAASASTSNISSANEVPAATPAITEKAKVPQHPDYKKYRSLLTASENILASVELLKPATMGSKPKRQLILTDAPRLFYIDPKTLSLKGEVEWKPSVSEVCFICALFINCFCRSCVVLHVVLLLQINDTTFEFVVSTRKYKFIDSVNGSQYWKDLIASTN